MAEDGQGRRRRRRYPEEQLSQAHLVPLFIGSDFLLYVSKLI